MGKLLLKTRRGFIGAFSPLEIMVPFSTGFQGRGKETLPMVKIERGKKIKVFQMSMFYGCDSAAGKSAAMQNYGTMLCQPKMQAAHHHLCPVGPCWSSHLCSWGGAWDVDTALHFCLWVPWFVQFTVEGRESWRGFLDHPECESEKASLFFSGVKEMCILCSRGREQELADGLSCP